ncbi:hypothetical protein [Microbulbifer sp. HZ11]|uniref:hypothetical protein n=1 Tax=Microbulbifer sp. HZ11 TaxID=1453501 RepID=UPI0005B8C437|nr:hypothetical protein [Microbulbifer sp. HZ11]
MTESEQVLERIFKTKEISFKKIPESATRTPDYEVVAGFSKSFWEVKEICENGEEKEIIRKFEADQGEIFSVHSKRVESSIKSASGQFKSFGVTNYPCIIVLTDVRDFSVRDICFELYIKSAMLGSAEYMEFRDGSVREINRKNGLMTNRMSYISAVALMYCATDQLVFLHNPNTCNELPEYFFNKFPEHYKVVNTSIGLEWTKV